MQLFFKCLKCGLPAETPYCTKCGGDVECRTTKQGCSKCDHLTDTKYCPQCGGRTMDVSIIEKPKSYSVRFMENVDWLIFCGACDYKPWDPEKAILGYCTECGLQNWKKKIKGGFVCQKCKDYTKGKYQFCGRCGGKMVDLKMERDLN